MAKEYANSRIWNIRNFKDAPLENYGKDFIIVCNENKFYLCFEPDAKMKHAPFCAAIYLFREQPRDTPVNVLWSICLINDSGVECFSSEIHTYFDGNIHQPMMGGVYNLNRKCVLNSSHGLLYDGNLTVKCSITVVKDPKPTLEKQIEKISTALQQNYEFLLENSKFSDVVFVVGGKQFNLHKNILSVRSKVFAAMFEHSELEEAKQNRVEIIDVDVEVFEQMLKYIYSGNVDSIEKYALDLLVASDKYQLESLKLLCTQSLIDNLTVESVAKILTISDMHAISELKRKCIAFFTRNAPQVIATDGWKQMGKQRAQLVMELYEDVVNVKKRRIS